MPKIKFVDFRAVKAAVTMEQVLQHYGLLEKMKRSGDSLSGCCPIHEGSNPTQFRVSISKNCWNCFSECKHGGNVIDFVARMENVSAHGAALKLIGWFNLENEPPSEESEPEPERPRQTTKAAPRAPAKPTTPPPEENQPNKPLGFALKDLDAKHPYLAERGLTAETITAFGLGYCAKGVMAGHIAIPIHNAEGELVAYCGRWPGEPAEDTPKYKLPAGFRKSQELFNLHRAILEPDEQPLVIVEGFFDVMKLWQHGCKCVVGLMGSSLSPTQERLLREHTVSNSQILLMLDADDAGRAASPDIAGRLSRFVFVKSVTLDDTTRQPEHLTPDQLQSLLD